MAGFRQKLLLVAFGLLVPLVLLALVEGALVLAGVGKDDGAEDPFVGFAPGSRLFEERVVDGERRYVTRPAKLAFFNEQSFPVKKGEGTYRIFSLGGSTTAGRPYDDKVSFSNWLRLYLADADPSRTWEVVNAGGVSYASYRLTLLMEELVTYQPDLFIVYTGHNEFLEERSYGEILRQPESLRQLRGWLARRRVASLLKGALAAGGGGRQGSGGGAGEVRLAGEVEARLDGWTGLDAYQRDEELTRGVEQHFAFNLRRLARLARQAGAGIVFVQPASNLKDFSPFKSQSGAGVSPEGVGRARALRQRAGILLAREDFAGAMAAAGEAVEIDPLFAEGWFLLGRSRFGLGEHEQAREALVRAKELDVAPLRALEAMVIEVAKAAAEEEAPAFDFPGYLGAVSRRRHGHDVLGGELFQDHVHPTLEVHSRIAEQLLRILAEQGVVKPGTAWADEASSTARAREIFQREVDGLDPTYYARRDMNLGKVLGWAGKLREAEEPLRRAAAVLQEEADVFLNLGILLTRTGRPEQAVPLLERARELDPGSPLADLNLGVAYGRIGETDRGIAALRSAIARRPNLVEAHFNLASLLRRRGDLQGAEAELREALELRPGAGETVAALASLLGETGRSADAERLLRERLEASPWAGGHVALAEVLAREDRLAEALKEARAASDLDPASAEAYYGLALILRRQGDAAGAETAYRQALAVDPGHAPSANNLALLRAAAGDLQGASELLLQAIDADPSYADAFFNLGVVYDQAGEAAEAARAIEKALELAPGTPRFLEALALLRQASEPSP